MLWFHYLGYLASAFAAGAFVMKRMIPLRLMIITANVLFIVYALIIGERVLLAIHLHAAADQRLAAPSDAHARQAR